MFSLHEFSAGMVSHISNKSNLKKKKKKISSKQYFNLNILRLSKKIKRSI